MTTRHDAPHRMLDRGRGEDGVRPPAPRPGSGPRILVAVASRHGATREIGATLARSLQTSEAGRSLGLSAVLAPVQLCPSPGDFDAVVLGSAVYAGRWLEAARQFAAARSGVLGRRPTWLFSSGVAWAATGVPGHAEDPERIGHRIGACGHRCFAGRVEPRVLSAAERQDWGTGAAGTDFRNWAAVRAWADEIVGEIRSRVPGPYLRPHAWARTAPDRRS